MTHKCAAVGCNSVKNGKTAVMFHRFPLKDPIRMFEWLKLCPPGTDPEKARIALCSKHFRRDQYLNITAKRPRLIHNAVPFQKRSMLLNGHDDKDQETEQKSLCKFLSPKKPAFSIINQSNKTLNLAQSSIPSTPSTMKILPKISLNQYSMDHTLNDCEESEDDEITVEVVMKGNSEAVDGSNTTPTNQGLILENINLKMQNQDLQLELTNSKKKLEALNNQVHNLSQLVDGMQCICETCNIHS